MTDTEPGWGAADLDRCEHGRHSVDPCYGCPGGTSTGNLFLSVDAIGSPGGPAHVRIGTAIQVRIGTTVRGEPIWATTHQGRQP